MAFLNIFPSNCRIPTLYLNFLSKCIHVKSVDRKVSSLSYPHRVLFGGNVPNGYKDGVRNVLKVSEKTEEKKRDQKNFLKLPTKMSKIEVEKTSNNGTKQLNYITNRLSDW